MAEELLSLKWNNHQSHFVDILSYLREQEIFIDASIACGGKVYQAHKFVLSTCSEYFKQMFAVNKSPHPIVFMKDVSCKDIEALLDFMYHGEVNVPQSSLGSLIKTAEGLQIKGLAVPDDPPSNKRERDGSSTLGSPPSKKPLREKSPPSRYNKVSSQNNLSSKSSISRPKSPDSNSRNDKDRLKNSNERTSLSSTDGEPPTRHSKIELPDKDPSEPTSVLASEEDNSTDNNNSDGTNAAPPTKMLHPSKQEEVEIKQEEDVVQLDDEDEGLDPSDDWMGHHNENSLGSENNSSMFAPDLLMHDVDAVMGGAGVSSQANNMAGTSQGTDSAMDPVTPSTSEEDFIGFSDNSSKQRSRLSTLKWIASSSRNAARAHLLKKGRMERARRQRAMKGKVIIGEGFPYKLIVKNAATNTGQQRVNKVPLWGENKKFTSQTVQPLLTTTLVHETVSQGTAMQKNNIPKTQAANIQSKSSLTLVAPPSMRCNPTIRVSIPSTAVTSIQSSNTRLFAASVSQPFFNKGSLPIIAPVNAASGSLPNIAPLNSGSLPNIAPLNSGSLPNIAPLNSASSTTQLSSVFASTTTMSMLPTKLLYMPQSMSFAQPSSQPSSMFVTNRPEMMLNTFRNTLNTAPRLITTPFITPSLTMNSGLNVSQAPAQRFFINTGNSVLQQPPALAPRFLIKTNTNVNQPRPVVMNPNPSSFLVNTIPRFQSPTVVPQRSEQQVIAQTVFPPSQVTTFRPKASVVTSQPSFIGPDSEMKVEDVPPYSIFN